MVVTPEDSTVPEAMFNAGVPPLIAALPEEVLTAESTNVAGPLMVNVDVPPLIAALPELVLTPESSNVPEPLLVNSGLPGSCACKDTGGTAIAVNRIAKPASVRDMV